MKELKRYHDTGEIRSIEREKYLQKKYEEIENLFGHESTLSKAVIYYLDKEYNK